MAKVLGIEIGSSVIRICETDYKMKNPHVYGQIMVQTPVDAVKDDVVMVTDVLVATIKNAMAAAKMHAKQVVFTINSPKIANREVNIPFVKSNRIADVVKLNAADYFPVDLEQYELGHSIIGTVENEKGIKQYRALVLAAPKVIVESYFRLASALGCTVAALDYSGNSIYQLVRSQCDTGVQMVIKIDEKSTMVTVIKNQIITLQRTVAYGVEDNIRAIIEASDYAKPDYRSALHTLYTNNCVEENVAEEWGEEAAASLNYLVSGIARVADYYNSRNEGAAIENVYVTGLGGNFAGMAGLVESALSIPVYPLNEVDVLHLPKGFVREELGIYLGCIGAAMAPIGFLGEKEDKKGTMEVLPGKESMKAISLLIFCGGILIAAALAVSSMIELAAVQNTNRDLQKRVKELEPIKEVYAEYLQEQYTWAKLNYLYGTTVTPNEILIEFIEEMEEKMPASLVVQSFMANEDGVTMSLTVLDKKEAAKLIRQFGTFKTISDVQVSGISDSGAVMEGEPIAEEGKVSFSVTLTYKGADELKAEQEAQ